MPTIETNDGMGPIIEDMALGHMGVETGGLMNRLVIETKRLETKNQRARYEQLGENLHRWRTEGPAKLAAIDEAAARKDREEAFEIFVTRTKITAIIIAGITAYNLIADIGAALAGLIF